MQIIAFSFVRMRKWVKITGRLAISVKLANNCFSPRQKLSSTRAGQVMANT
jgi:hypothetical protein